MKTINLLKASLIAPIALVSTLGISNAASAVTLKNGDQLSINLPGVQINAAGFPQFLPTLPGGYPTVPPETSGGSDSAFNINFGKAISGANGSLNTSSPNVVLNQPAGTPVIYPNGSFTDIVPGFKGDFGVGSTSGGFDDLAALQLGTITSFDGIGPGASLNEVNGTTGNFLEVAGGTANFVFTLDQITSFCYTPTGITKNPYFQISASNPRPGCLTANGDLLASMVGKVTVSGVTYNVRYTFNGSGFRDNASSGDPRADDGVSNVTTQQLTAVVEQVPEPSSLGSLAAIVGLGVLASRKKLSRR